MYVKKLVLIYLTKKINQIIFLKNLKILIMIKIIFMKWIILFIKIEETRNKINKGYKTLKNLMTKTNHELIFFKIFCIILLKLKTTMTFSIINMTHIS